MHVHLHLCEGGAIIMPVSQMKWENENLNDTSVVHK